MRRDDPEPTTVFDCCFPSGASRPMCSTIGDALASRFDPELTTLIIPAIMRTWYAPRENPAQCGGVRPVVRHVLSVASHQTDIYGLLGRSFPTTTDTRSG